MRMPRTAAALVPLAVAALLAGCSGSFDETAGGGGGDSGASQVESAEDEAAGAAAAARGGGSVDAGSGAIGASENASSSALAAAVAPRVVRTAEIAVRVEILRTAAAKVRAVAEGLGGRVASETTGFRQEVAGVRAAGAERDGEQPVSAAAGESVLVLRVPEPQLSTALDRVAAVGTELSRASTAQDVSADLADLESRERTQRASVERVRRLMDRAGSLRDVVTLEAELAKRESELEAVQARRATLSDRADLATLTAVLREPDVRPEEEDPENSLLTGLRGSWDTLVASTGVLLAMIGAVIPFALLAAVVAWPAMRLWRRRSHRPATPAPAGPAQP